MTTGIRVAVVGGGSSYTPELVEGFLNYFDVLPVERITLIDVPMGADKVRIVGELARRMVARARREIAVDWTLDRREPLAGADFVCQQFRVGGLKARERDETIPLRYGAIGQETCGAGGLAKGLRTVPVALGIAHELEEYNPKAWIVNFTNPAGMITEAILRYSTVRVIGLCNVPINMQREIAAHLGVEPERVSLEMFGLNHLSFVRHVYLDGRDITDKVVRAAAEAVQGMANIPPQAWGTALIRMLGLIPNDYLRYYWFPDAMLAHEQAEVESGKGTRATQVMAIEKALFRRYADPDLAEKPRELEQRGGAYYSEVAVSTIRSIATNTPAEMVVNVQNGRALSDLPENASVEISSLVDGRGARPLVQGPMPLAVRGLIQQVKSYESMTIDAAVSGDRDLALAALLANPLVPSLPVAGPLLEDIIRENAEYLPQFRA